jgi:predicted nucleotidyltransferase
VILFGSYAYGNPDEDSDIDLLIVTDIEKEEEKKRLRAILRKKIPPVGAGKDFIIVSPQELESYKDIVGTVIYPALKKGKILYERRD